MKRIFFLMLIWSFVIAIFAQTQQGYVKTKGRLGNNGNVIAGTRLSGAIVTVKNGNTVVSGSNGVFSLSVPNSSYYLQNVQKQGYVLTDPDVLAKQYVYSKNPLVLVLETPSLQTDDKLAAEKKIRRTLQRQLQDKEDEIESLKELQKISEEEYRKQLQEIYAQQENNEKLISEMADRYSKMDFDEVDDFNRRISSLILEGRLTEADSLLNTKGDINSRAATLRQHQEANAQEEQSLKKKQKKLEKSKAMTQKELEDIAHDCYSKFEIFKMQHQNDSAAYYIETRTKLDTLNLKWQLSAGKFFQDYLADYSKSLTLYQSCLHQAIQTCDSSMIAICLNQIGTIYYNRADYDNALDCFQKSLAIYESFSNTLPKDYIEVYNNIGVVYKERDSLEYAMHFFNLALKESIQIKDNYSQTSSLYNSIGNFYYSMAKYQEAHSCFEQALSLSLSICGENNPLVATSYNNLSFTYNFLNDSLNAYNANIKALNIRKVLYGEFHPDVALSYNNIGSAYISNGNYDKAIEYLKKAISISEKVLGNKHPDVAISLNNLGGVYLKKNEFDKALVYFEKSLQIRKLLFGEESSSVATGLTNIGGVLFNQRNYDKSLEYFEQALNIRKKIFNDAHPLIAAIYRSQADVYYAKGQLKKALELYESAYSIFQKSFPVTNKNVIATKNKVEEIRKELQE